MATPRPLAAAIIAHFNPRGAILDPCRGNGAFYDQFPAGVDKDWCEITEGRDFLTYHQLFAAREDPFDWCISNPPYSIWRHFTQRAMLVADNIVWLTPINHVWLKARRRDMAVAGFGIREICEVDTPAKKTGWPQSGFSLGACHLQRGYKGPIILSCL